MSLSRIVKKPGNVVFNEFVQIKEKDVIQKIQSEITFEPNYDLSDQIIQDAQEEANRLLDQAKLQIEQLRNEFNKECEKTFIKVKEEAFEVGYQEGKDSIKQEVLNHLEGISDELIKLQEENNHHSLNLLNEFQDKTYQIGIEVASTILKNEINHDSSVLKNMILNEIDIRKNQNIRMIEISKKAEELIFELKNELELRGILLQISDDDFDHIVLEGDSGHYDLSISTQLKNIRRLFNTL